MHPRCVTCHKQEREELQQTVCHNALSLQSERGSFSTSNSGLNRDIAFEFILCYLEVVARFVVSCKSWTISYEKGYSQIFGCVKGCRWGCHYSLRFAQHLSVLGDHALPPEWGKSERIQAKYCMCIYGIVSNAVNAVSKYLVESNRVPCDRSHPAYPLASSDTRDRFQNKHSYPSQAWT